MISEKEQARDNSKHRNMFWYSLEILVIVGLLVATGIASTVLFDFLVEWFKGVWL